MLKTDFKMNLMNLRNTNTGVPMLLHPVIMNVYCPDKRKIN